MSIKEIAASAKACIDDLEDRVPNFWSNLGVNEVSGILRVVSFAFLSINKLAREVQPDHGQILSEEQLQRVISLIGDLADNFFPMAHTTEPYVNLRIISYKKFQFICEQSAHDVNVLQELLQQIDHLKSDVNSRIENIERHSEMLHEVLNP